MNQNSPLILASGSRYRANLLRRIVSKFQVEIADIDETPLPGEAPEACAMRLAQSKSGVVAARFPEHWVIGSDQVAALGDKKLSKPGDYKTALSQLRACSGRKVVFYTSVVLQNLDKNYLGSSIDKVVVQFRTLNENEISQYLNYEKPFDCAGSFKVESAGITLFESVKSKDPTSLEGLPLISLSHLMRDAGLSALFCHRSAP